MTDQVDSANASSWEIERLLVTTAALGTLAALVALVAPRIPASIGVARLVAEGWVIGALLITGWSAPRQGPRRIHWFVGLVALYALLFSLDVAALSPSLLSAVTLAVLATGALVGGYIGGLLQYPGMLMVVAYVAALADCFSVFHPSGLTAQVMANPKVLALLTVPFPVLGTERVASLVGIGDVVFVSLFVVGSRATGLSSKRTLAALALALVAVAATVELFELALPALPFLSAAVVIAHPEARKLPKHETRRILANLAVVTLVLGGLLLSAALRST